MGEYSLKESAWRRGWHDTKAVWTSWQFYVLDAVVAVMIGGIFAWYWGLAIVIFGMICVWIGATAGAPIKQRNEARRELLRHKGLLLIRAKGRRRLEESLRSKPMKTAWYFRVIIANPSVDKNLDIRSIFLRSKDHPELTLSPTAERVGAGLSGQKDEGLLGDIDSVVYLQASEPKAGTLVFVGDGKNFGDKWNEGRLFDGGTIVLVDSQGIEHSFPTDITQISPLPESSLDKEVSQT